MDVKYQRKALEFFHEAIDADSSYTPALIRAGVLHMNLGEASEAEPLLKKAASREGPEQEVAQRAYKALETRKKWTKGRSKLRVAAALARGGLKTDYSGNSADGAGRPITAPADMVTQSQEGLGTTSEAEGGEASASGLDAPPERPMTALPERSEVFPEEMDDDALQEEIRAIKAELYKTKADVLEAYAAAASIEAEHMQQVEELQTEVQNNRFEAAELMKSVSAEHLNAELLTLIESGQLLPVDEAFDRGYGHPNAVNLQPTLSRPNTPARPASALL